MWFLAHVERVSGRIGGGAEWNRRVMYRAIREGYVKCYRRKHKRHVIRSLSLTQKGFDYVAQSDPEAVAMIYSRINCSERVYPSKVDKILRLHAIAVGTVMAHAADAEILISQKPSLMLLLCVPRTASRHRGVLTGIRFQEFPHDWYCGQGEALLFPLLHRQHTDVLDEEQ